MVGGGGEFDPVVRALVPSEACVECLDGGVVVDEGDRRIVAEVIDAARHDLSVLVAPPGGAAGQGPGSMVQIRVVIPGRCGRPGASCWRRREPRLRRGGATEGGTSLCAFIMCLHPIHCPETTRPEPVASQLGARRGYSGDPG